jgi:hypothetical protein
MTTVEQQPRVRDTSQVAELKRKNRVLSGIAGVLAIGLAVTVLWVVLRSDSTADLQNQIEVAQEIADGLGAAVEAADARGVSEFFAEDALFEDPAARTAVTGRAAVEAMYMGFLTTGAPIENTAVLVGPGFAITEFVWTQPCTFVACSPEIFREPVEVRGIVLHVIEDGEVTRETDYIAYPRSLLLVP